MSVSTVTKAILGHPSKKKKKKSCAVSRHSARKKGRSSDQRTTSWATDDLNGSAAVFATKRWHTRRSFCFFSRSCERGGFNESIAFPRGKHEWKPRVIFIALLWPSTPFWNIQKGSAKAVVSGQSKKTWRRIELLKTLGTWPLNT